MVDCRFENLCKNADIECEFCQYNRDACLYDYFEWNGEDEEPAKEELEEEMH